MKERDASTALRVWLARNPQMYVKKLADMLGVHRTRISEWSFGKGKPSRKSAGALERVTGGAVPASAWDDEEPGDSLPPPPMAA